MIATVAEVRPQLGWDELVWLDSVGSATRARSAAGFETYAVAYAPGPTFRMPPGRHPGPAVVIHQHRAQSRYLDPRGPVVELTYCEARWAPAWLPLVGYALDPDVVLEALASASLAFRVGLSATFQEFGAAVALGVIAHAIPAITLPGLANGELAREVDRDWRARITDDETRWWLP